MRFSLDCDAAEAVEGGAEAAVLTEELTMLFVPLAATAVALTPAAVLSEFVSLSYLSSSDEEEEEEEEGAAEEELGTIITCPLSLLDVFLLLEAGADAAARLLPLLASKINRSTSSDPESELLERADESRGDAALLGASAVALTTEVVPNRGRFYDRKKKTNR